MTHNTSILKYKVKGIRYKAKGIRYKAKGLVWVVKVAFAFLFILLAVTATVSAQTITATLDRDKIVLGEQVTLQLKLEGINTNSAFLVAWFNLPETANHIQVIRKDTTDTIEVNGLTTYLQHVTITSFDSGRWAIPLQRLVIQDKATGKQTRLRADSVFLQVLPVDVSGLKDYHDIKNIIDVPAKTNYTLLIAGILSVIALAVLAILLYKRKKRAPVPVNISKPAEYVSPLDEALQKIAALRKEGLPAKGQTKLFYTLLDDICRAYFGRRMKMQPKQSTSDELMIKLGVYLQDREMKTKFYQLLRLVDAVKFAKYLPAEQQHEEALQSAAVSLQHIERQIQMANRHVN